ncbi:MAG TPA: RsmB/NOP family class I SAM-dependent RNA methyltransferase [Bacteroidia bacterium]|jgi:16S rRNA (cytosine967-C5)-methyltransferase|nr:RsmB/NOP family class I SAM-dependent RNA methyltransferase [Bacteroidia bacterium]
MRPKSDHKGPAPLLLLKEALEYYYLKGFAADRALNETFRHHKLRDERLRADLAKRLYGIIRFRRPIVTAIGEERFETTDDLKLLVDTFNKFKKIYKGEELPGKDEPIVQKLMKYMRVRKMRESFDDFFDELALKELGEEKWNEVSAELNRDPRLFLRVNTLKTTKAELIALLKAEGMNFSDVNGGEEALMSDEFYNVFTSDAFHQGFFEIQDISSQQVSQFCDLKSGLRVLDACAGNGGKTLHLAALMKNKGKIIAMDVSERKLDELRSRCVRNGVDVVETKLVNAKTNFDEMKNTFDRVLIDIPCSGTGVMKRNPDIKWRFDARNLQELQLQQQNILNTYAQLVKPGGKLIYASCSILPSEGEMQIKKFLESADGGEKWEKEDEIRIDPSFGDGFFMCRLKKIS